MFILVNDRQVKIFFLVLLEAANCNCPHLVVSSKFVEGFRLSVNRVAESFGLEPAFERFLNREDNFTLRHTLFAQRLYPGAGGRQRFFCMKELETRRLLACVWRRSQPCGGIQQVAVYCSGP
jgi:hypothetical protein